MNHCHLA